MSKPINVFTTTTKTAKTGNFVFLSQQVAYWQQLSKLVQPYLPQPEQWQVVCHEQGILTLSGLNQAMVSQLNYMQAHYVALLAKNLASTDLYNLSQLNKIRARLRYDAPTANKAQTHLNREISPATQQLLRETARLVQDAKLSQALMDLASDKK